MRLYNAIAEYIEARAELIREEASTTGLGLYARAYKEGQDDLLGCECGCQEGIGAEPNVTDTE
jgi:hypothetical protein